ncbi:hypothetical protein Tsubulata_021626 [Turnera subulata]|uniref:Uncharacterized protein n=1 Tax=Turnera subulata TaxID=218843 RepID=A0A9Q0FGA1_9ROSI|nr:hypothetical protein Tsubulata_021626 [Turnera subulata]
MTVSLSKLFFSLIFLTSLFYNFWSLSNLFAPFPFSAIFDQSIKSYQANEAPQALENTSLQHIVFGIAGSASLWSHRKNYIKLWWRPSEMRGIVWLEKQVENDTDNDMLPPIRVSNSTSQQLNNYGFRLSRIVSETFRLGMKDVRWFVMGDDDTVFIPENLVRVLSKYDHNQYYYIGSSSESHMQNIHFSYGMAFGGGGFAISYPLAKALERMQDRCTQRYPALYSSDDRIHACVTELGVPLTKEPGFHQFDIYGNLFGLLTAHPIAPLVSLHHLDVISPILPYGDRFQALEKLKVPMKLDSAALMQQSICYDKPRNWSISVSWGYAVQIYRGIYYPRELVIPARTFLHWYKRSDPHSYAFNTRPVSTNSCQMPFVYVLRNGSFNADKEETNTEYVNNQKLHPPCDWKIADPFQIRRVEVHKKPDPHLWDKAPRRNCCRVQPSKKRNLLVVDVGVCGEGEVIELQ